MSTEIKLTKAQIFKLLQFGGSFGSCIGNLGKKLLTNVAIPFSRDNLPGLVNSVTSNVINKAEKKGSGKGSVTVGNG